VGAEVVVPHPPVTITLEYVIELLFETFVVVPSLVFVSELTCPLTLTPRVPDSNELKIHALDLDDLLDTVGMVEQNTRVTHSFLKVAVLIFHSVGATKEESLLMVLFKLFPELASFDLLSYIWSSQVELL